MENVLLFLGCPWKMKRDKALTLSLGSCLSQRFYRGRMDRIIRNSWRTFWCTQPLCRATFLLYPDAFWKRNKIYLRRANETITVQAQPKTFKSRNYNTSLALLLPHNRSQLHLSELLKNWALIAVIFMQNQTSRMHRDQGYTCFGSCCFSTHTLFY